MQNKKNPFNMFENMGQQMPFFNVFENMGQQAPKMPQMPDMGRMREQATKNMEAMTQANQIAAEGMQAIARRTAEIMQRATQNGMECFRDACSSKSVEDAQRIQSAFVSDMMHTCSGNVREVTEMASKAAMEIVDVCNKSISDTVCEFSNCTTQHSSAKPNGKADKK
jgi:phasin family protein